MKKGGLVLVARFPKSWKAHLARARLEAEVVSDEHSPTVLPGLRVPSEWAEEADRILDETPFLFERGA